MINYLKRRILCPQTQPFSDICFVLTQYIGQVDKTQGHFRNTMYWSLLWQERELHLSPWQERHCRLTSDYISMQDTLVQKRLLNKLKQKSWLYRVGFFHQYSPNFSTKKTAEQPITAFLSNRIYRNSSSDWLIVNFLFGTKIRWYQWNKSPCTYPHVT